MKLTRKLIPAFAMLLIAAVMMSTASFAWFSMNGKVTAEGMSVTATTPASLEIKSETTDWDYKATVNVSKNQLNAVTYYNGTWYVPSASNDINKDGKTSQPLSETTIGTYWTAVNIADYALVTTFSFRTNAGNDAPAEINPVKFKAKAAKSGTSQLMDGVKIYIQDASGVYEIATGENAVSGPQSGWEAPVARDNVDPLTLTVIVIYDGESNDGNGNYYVKNDNADTIATSISLTFEKVSN